MKKFYIIDSNPNGATIPYFFESEWTPELPVFDLPQKNPSVKDFESRYKLRAKIDELSVDVLIGDFLASLDFIMLCESLRTQYISIAAEVTVDGGKKTSKDYFFFCVTARSSVLNESESRFELMDERLLRPKEERSALPVYERIDKFVMRDDIVEDLIYCEEIKRVICSAEFKSGFESRKLTGLNFVPINEDYVYAPWNGF